MATPVERALIDKQIPFRFFRHAGPVRSLEQAAAERGQQPSQVIRSLLFRISGGDFVMLLVSGPDQVNWRALRRYLNESRLTTASEEEVITMTGYQPGAVSPLGLPQPIRLLVDEQVFAWPEISIGSGERGTTIILRSEDLQRALPEFELIHLTGD